MNKLLIATVLSGLTLGGVLVTNPEPVVRLATESEVTEPISETTTPIEETAPLEPVAEPVESTVEPDPAPTSEEPAEPPVRDLFQELRVCLTGGDYTTVADDPDNGRQLYGAYLFDRITYYSMTGRGTLPSNDPPEIQDAAAKKLVQTRGWYYWPDCAQQLGLQ